MNSKKKIIFFSFIISLLLLPLVSYRNVGANYIIRNKDIILPDNEISFSPPKFLPPPPSNGSYTADYFDGRGIESANFIFSDLSNIFPLAEIPSSRIWDLVTVQYALTCVDMFFVNRDPNYLNSGRDAVQTLHLDINGTFILGEDDGAFYHLNADENLLLVIMYNRLAQGFLADGDAFTAESLRNQANLLFADLTSLFYSTTTNTINSTLFLSKSTFDVVGVSQGSSAKATGLYFMANFMSNQTSTYYPEAKLAVDNYRTIANATVNLPSGDLGFLYRSSDEITSVEYNEVALQGNIYLNTALMQISKFEEINGDLGASDNYYNWTNMGEVTLKEYLKSPTTNLLHTKYNLVTTILEDAALTYENCLYLSHAIEFKRFKLEHTGIAPSFIEVSNLFEALYTSVFNDPDYFLAGLTKSGTQLDLVPDIPHSNPHIVNYQAITMLLKLYPMKSMLVRPTDLIPSLPMICDWFIDIPETSSIFKASNKTFSFYYVFDISSNTIDSITFPEKKRLNTTSLDGVILQGSQKVTLNITSSEGGDHFLILKVNFSNFNIFDFDLFLTFKKLFRISTEPTNPEMTQLLDKELVLSVFCEDEISSSVADAQVTIFVDIYEFTEITDNGGYATFFIPIETFNFAKPPPDFGDYSSYNASIHISVNKPGFLRKDIDRKVIIRLNELVLDISPAPEGKEGSDLTLYLDVETRIEAPLFNIEATIRIDGIDFTDTSGYSTFQLPSTIIIGKEYLKPNDWIRVDVTMDIPGMSVHTLSFEVFTVPLQTLERIYYWLEIAFSSNVVRVLCSLGIVWALLWRQFSLKILKRLRRCPYCGDITKTKYPYCKNCGLKDMTKKYKKAVHDSKKEPRILTNERMLFRRKDDKESNIKQDNSSFEDNQNSSSLESDSSKDDYQF